MVKLFRCGKGSPSYSCPRCNLMYCSLACYREPSHKRCVEGFTQDNFSNDLRHESVDEETKRQMMEILKRFNNLEMDGNEIDVETSNLGFLGELKVEDVDNMNAEELLARIGPEVLKRFENDLKNNPEFIEAALKEWKPWWIPPPKIKDSTVKSNQDPLPEPLEELPPLHALTKERPPEMLWNNLIEMIYLYVYYNRTYHGDLLIYALDFSKDYLKMSNVLRSKRFAHPSVLHALRSMEASITMEAEQFLSGETKILLLDDILNILAKANNILLVLADLHRVFERCLSNSREFFFAAKKTYFYNVWLNDEISSDSELVNTILISMRALITGYREKLVSFENPSGDEIKKAFKTKNPEQVDDLEL